MKFSDFSSFWSFLMKLAEIERVSEAVTTEVRARDPIEACDLKTARNGALFWCPVSARACDELADVGGVGGCKMMSLGVCKLVWTCATSFVSPAMLQERFSGVVWVKIDCFSSFWGKPAIVERVSRAVVVMDGADEFKEVSEGPGEEKRARFGEISIVVQIFMFFLFLESAGSCDVFTDVLGFV